MMGDILCPRCDGEIHVHDAAYGGAMVTHRSYETCIDVLRRRLEQFQRSVRLPSEEQTVAVPCQNCGRKDLVNAMCSNHFARLEAPFPEDLKNLARQLATAAEAKFDLIRHALAGAGDVPVERPHEAINLLIEQRNDARARALLFLKLVRPFTGQKLRLLKDMAAALRKHYCAAPENCAAHKYLAQFDELERKSEEATAKEKGETGAGGAGGGGGR